MCLISFNAPDHSAQLNAINGNLYEIAENTKKIGYSLDSIREDMRRVAEASEVVAGIITKEEIQIKQAIQRIQDNDSIMNGYLIDRNLTDIDSEKIDEIFEVKPNPACLPIPGNGKGDTERWEQLFRGEL